MTSEMTQGEPPAWTLGWRLQRALAHAGLSIEEMAAELGVSRQTVSRWLNEHGSPKRGYLTVWAMRCGVPFDWLTGDAREVVQSGHIVRKSAIPDLARAAA